MSQADEIRKYVYERYIRPAKQKGDKSVTIRAGDIGKEMNISGNMPNICQALGGKKLAEMCGVKIEISDDPNPSTTTNFTYIFENIEEPENLKNRSANLTMWLSETLDWFGRLPKKTLIIILFVVLFIVADCIDDGTQSDKIPQTSSKTPETPQQTQTQTQPQTQAEKIVMPQYTVLNEDIFDDIFNGVYIKTQYELSILVSGEITEQGLRALLNELYSKMQLKRFENRRNPTHFVIWAYTSKEYAESDSGQQIAMLTKLGDRDIKISFNERQMAQIGVKPEEKVGLSEAQRREIWNEIVKAEDRTTNGILSQKEKNDLAKKYGLTLEQLQEIRIEGLTKDWPFPKYEGN